MIFRREAWALAAAVLLVFRALGAEPSVGAGAGEPEVWAEENLKAGKYGDAAEQLRKALAAAPEDGAKRAALTVKLAEVLRVVGEAEEGVKLCDAMLKSESKDRAALLIKGQLLTDLGRYEEALQTFNARLEADKDDHRAWALRKLAAQALGRQELLKETRDHFFKLFNDRSPAFYRKDPSADPLEPAYVGLGIQEENPKDAFEVGYMITEDLIQTRKLRAPEPLLWMAHLAMEKYHFQFAAARFNAVLKMAPNHPDALAGMAQIFWNTRHSYQQAEPLLARALEVNPRHVPARLLSAVMALTEDKHDEAKKHLDVAVAANPNHLETLSLQAFFHHDAGELQKEAEIEKRVLALNPGYADYYCNVGELIESKRGFEEAPAYYRKAIALDPKHWRGYYDLGMNTSRQGAHGEEEGKALLLKAFSMNRFNVWASNMIKVLDTINGDQEQRLGPKYRASRTAHFTLKFRDKESAILQPYIEEWAEAAYARQSRLFQFEPAGPLSIEVCYTNGDLSARTVGIPTLGILGVCFGKLCTVLSPREGGEGKFFPPFNWRRVMEHEFAHVMTLQMSKFRIPRWYTEGWSTYIEDDSRLSSDQLMVNAIAKNQLLPIERMHEYFRGNMLLAYLHGRYLIEYLDKNFGMGVHRQALRLLGEGKKAEEILPQLTGKPLADLNREQLAYVRGFFSKNVRLRPTYDQAELAKVEAAAAAPEASAADIAELAMARLMERKMRTAESLAMKATAKDPNCALGLEVLGRLALSKEDLAGAKKLLELSVKAAPETSFQPWLHLGLIYKKEARTSKAIEALEKARALYPRFSGPESPYFHLPELYQDLEPPRMDLALQVWKDAIRNDTACPAAALEGLKLAVKLKDWRSAVDFALAHIEVDPYEIQTHRLAAQACEELKDWGGAAREYRVAAALDEKDVASLCGLARAELAAGRDQEAAAAVAAALRVDQTHEAAKELRRRLEARGVSLPAPKEE